MACSRLEELKATLSRRQASLADNATATNVLLQERAILEAEIQILQFEIALCEMEGPLQIKVKATKKANVKSATASKAAWEKWIAKLRKCDEKWIADSAKVREQKPE